VNGFLDQWNTNLNPLVWALNVFYGVKDGTDWLGNPQSRTETNLGYAMAIIPLGRRT